MTSRISREDVEPEKWDKCISSSIPRYTREWKSSHTSMYGSNVRKWGDIIGGRFISKVSYKRSFWYVSSNGEYICSDIARRIHIWFHTLGTRSSSRKNKRYKAIPQRETCSYLFWTQTSFWNRGITIFSSSTSVSQLHSYPRSSRLRGFLFYSKVSTVWHIAVLICLMATHLS